MEDLEYITKDALIMCDQGGAPDFFKPTFNTHIKIHGCLMATNMDAAPLVNIPSFKLCKITQKPCTPATAPMTWKDTWDVKVKGIKTLIGKSTCLCPIGGTVEFMTSGQIPLPPEALAEVDALKEQADREIDDAGHGDSVGETGFWEGMIPLWGSGRDLINDVQTGDGWGVLMNGGFLVLDVVSLGTVSTAVKAAGKGTAKVVQKVSQKALQQLGKSGFKKLSKEALKKSVDDVAKKLLRTCVFACFPAGTLIQMEHGTKNIEDIRVGDFVWAYNEETKEVALKEVLSTIVNESDHTISIYTEQETIETTATHPFYTLNGWIDASELKSGDKVLTQQGDELEIKNTTFHYTPKKVYNFEVEGWHTYFVGVFSWLVHNAGCARHLAMLTRKSVDDKLARYLLNPNHPVGGSKAKWFKEALGFTMDNADDLAKQIAFNPSKAVKTAVTEFGTKFNQVISITGANGKTIDVTFAWIKNNDEVIRLVTSIPTKIK